MLKVSICVNKTNNRCCRTLNFNIRQGCRMLKFNIRQICRMLKFNIRHFTVSGLLLLSMATAFLRNSNRDRVSH